RPRYAQRGCAGRRGDHGAAGRDLRIPRQLQGHAHGPPAAIPGWDRAGGQAGAARLAHSTSVRDQSLVDARDRSFQSAPCFCQFIRMGRLVLLFLPSATDWLSPTQWNRTIAAGPTTRICGSRYSSDRNFDFPLVALAMKVALSSTRPSEWL